MPRVGEPSRPTSKIEPAAHVAAQDPGKPQPRFAKRRKPHAPDEDFNPALGDKTFQGLSGSQYGGVIDASARMTLSGTVNKTGILLVCVFATAAWTWRLFLQSHDTADVAPLLLVGVFWRLHLCHGHVFKKEWSPITAPIYALLEGLFLGGISAVFDVRYPGIAIQAVGLTLAPLRASPAYSSGVIKVTEKFRLGIVAATGGIMIFYLLQMVLGFFGIQFAAINGSGSSASSSASSSSPSPAESGPRL